MAFKLTCVLLIFLFTTIKTEQELFLEDVSALIEKYSNVSTDHLNESQLQDLLNNLQRCNESSTGLAVNTTTRTCSVSGGCNGSEECLSAGHLYSLLNIQDGRFDSYSLKTACPLILRHVESHVCGNAKKDFSSESSEPKKPSALEVWGLGFLFVTVISLCSLLGVTFLPLMDKDFYKQLLMVLIGLAVGSLSASSVFHLIPQAFRLADEDAEHKYLTVSFMLWAGIWVFFLTERIMRIIGNAKNHSHAHSELPCKDLSADVVSAISSPTELLAHDHEEPLSDGCMLPKYNYQDQVIRNYANHELSHESHSHNPPIHFEQGKDSVIATVAWMIIFGDGFHNFIDGLSIGAAFNESILTGISISVAVMCEELPHELGDFAVLLNAGMTMRQALVYNFLSACTCYLGLTMGILLGEFEASSYIFGFAAGMFMYISLVDMMPELNAAAEEASKVSWKKAVKTLTLQNIGLIIGVVALYILARFQDSITFEM